MPNQPHATSAQTSAVMLASHYLRTPLTHIQLGVEGAAELEDTTRNQLLGLVPSLAADIETLIARTTTAAEQVAVVSDPAQPAWRVLISGYFLLPLLLVLALGVVSDYVFIAYATIRIPPTNLLLEVLAFVAAAALFYTVIRRRALRRQERLGVDRLAEDQARLNAAKNGFIHDGGLALSAHVQALKGLIPPVASSVEGSALELGVRELDSLVYKFELLTSLTPERARDTQTFSLHDLVSDIERSDRLRLEAKHITLAVDQATVVVHQSRELIDFVVRSIIDNAIKFSPEGSRVSVAWHQAKREVTLVIEDHGKGIPTDYRTHLFEPFSRPGSVETYAQEGLGLSLYLDKIILSYLGGELKLETHEGHGTRVAVRLPLGSLLPTQELARASN